MVLASLPDDKQKQRIQSIMQSPEKLHVRGDVGSGLLLVAKELSRSQTNQQYSGGDYHNHRPMIDRYMDAIKELRKVRPVAEWMLENKPLCEWIDQFSRSDSSNNQNRGDYLNRRDRGPIHHAPGALYEHNSDSDLNGELNDSDESDDYGGNEFKPGVVIVRDAGLAEINGAYTSNKKFDGVPRFSKTGVWKGQQQEFTLFRCMLSDQTRRWYISIIPPNHKPGTNKDIDFYLCPAAGTNNEVPHGCVWQTTKEIGVDPPPIVEWKSQLSNISDDTGDNLIDHRVTSNDEYDDIADDNNYDDALMEDEVQQ
jgi:ubiquitin carboxyl-terminal hydrolase 9/24